MALGTVFGCNAAHIEKLKEATRNNRAAE